MLDERLAGMIDGLLSSASSKALHRDDRFSMINVGVAVSNITFDSNSDAVCRRTIGNPAVQAGSTIRNGPVVTIRI